MSLAASHSFCRRLVAVMILLPAMILTGVTATAAVAEDDGRFVLAIDPGHGGNDLGTSGSRLHEKNVTLQVARLLRDMLAERLGDSVKVVMTRDADIFVPLRERAAIANRANADLFVSIHVNSIAKRSRGRRTIKGTSVYTLGLHKSEANLSVAMAENAVIELEEDFSEAYQGFDPNVSESYIIFELGQNRNMEQSLEMASLAQHFLVSHAGRADREVRQAGFLVLWATKMPAVLVELDFMCNPDIERYFGTERGRKELAESLYLAVDAYRRLHPHNPAASVRGGEQ